MERDIPKEIELLVAMQTVMSRNLEALFEVTQRNTLAIERNTLAIDKLTARLDSLATTVDTYIRGLRNGK